MVNMKAEGRSIKPSLARLRVSMRAQERLDSALQRAYDDTAPDRAAHADSSVLLPFSAP